MSLVYKREIKNKTSVYKKRKQIVTYCSKGKEYGTLLRVKYTIKNFKSRFIMFDESIKA